MNLNIFRCLLLLFIFSACKTDKEEKPPQLRFEEQNVTRKEGENCDTEDFDCSIAILDIVMARGPQPLADKINQNILRHLLSLIPHKENRPPKNPEALAEHFLQEYLEAAENFSEEPPWEIYVNQKIYFKSDSLISLGTTTEIFSGGAHGYNSLSFLNIDPQTGNILRNKELFGPGFRDYAEKAFREQQGIPAEGEINSTGFWFEGDSFHLPENVGFTENKIILVYNSYEIAPYSAGDVYMEISRKEAERFLKIE